MQNSANSISNKISVSLYFYQLSHFEHNKEYEKLAEKYLEDVFSEIHTVREVDIKNGLSGIGLGINYLVKNNFVSGNINIILQEIDNYLFKVMSVPQYHESANTFSMIQVLYYFYVRLKDQKKDNENEYLFQELCVKTINNIYSKIGKALIGNRLAYNVESELPLFLYVLSKISILNIYNVRITNILNELSPIVLSTIPMLHCNKLYLLWSMSAIYEQIKISGWNAHIELLIRELNLDEIVNTELKNRNIFFNDGATSIFLLAENVKKHLGEEIVYDFQRKLLKKIEQSEVWYLLKTDLQYFSTHNNLYDGFCGVVLLLMSYKKNDL
ncbi:MAG: hypothetical protein LBK47_09585 [Prevotellaceae bacterium]|nr:hypothetical protein [Prevotellaceae bacterium]